MPLTAAEKMRRRRQKLKDEGRYEEYKRVHKATAKKSRQKKMDAIKKLPKTLQDKIIKVQRLKTKQRVAKCRNLKQELKERQKDQNLIATHPYKNSSSLGKATAKVRRMLPKSPRKKKAVVQQLYSSFIDHSQGSCVCTAKPKTSRSTVLSEQTVKLVQDFYQSDDVSRQAPGLKDVTTVRKDDGSKEKLQTRHLYSSLKETYALFVAEHVVAKVGKSKFAELRPKHVLLSSKLPHNVCLCKYHENFIIAVDSFHKAVSHFPAYNNGFVESMVCEPPTNNCWLSNCEICKNSLKDKFAMLFDLPDTDLSSEVMWYVWKEEDGRLCKVVEEGTIEELSKYILEIVPQFLEHCYVKRQQADTYKMQREAAGIEGPDQMTALLQVDFSENFTCIAQDEIQSFHWVQPQASLFTASLWYSGKQHPIVIVSDVLNHTKDTVIAYMDRLLEEVPATVQVVRIWSDGPSSQFKNRYVAACLTKLQDKHSKTIIWNFFATSHGKGAVDGIGGSLKKQVRSAVMSRKHNVFNANQFVRAAQDVSTIKVIELSATDIENRNQEMNLSQVFAAAPPVAGISRAHLLKVQNNGVATFLLSKQETAAIGTDDHPAVSNGFINDEGSDICLDDWFEVEYDTTTYYGVVTEIGQNDFKINVMAKSGRFWKWPEPRDEIFYPREKLKRKVQPPTVVNNRGCFVFT